MSKLKTMLLPTGEFVYVLSEVNPDDIQLASDGLTPFRIESGAASLLVTSDRVEVEDALYEETAVRRDYQVDTYSDVEEGELGPEWKDVGYIDESQTFTAAKPGDFISASEASASGGVEILPVGLPTIEDFHRIAQEVSNQVILSSGSVSEENLFKLFNTGAKVSPAGLVVGGERSEDNDVAEKLTERPLPEPGDTVVITGESYFGNGDLVGRTGTVVRNIASKTPDDHVLVEIEDLDEPDEPYSLFYHRDNFEFQPAAPRLIQVGDLVRVVVVNGWRDAKSFNPNVGLVGPVTAIRDSSYSDPGENLVYVVQAASAGLTGEVWAVEVELVEPVSEDDGDYETTYNEDEDY